ncbi:MAG: SET domain-containing protein-lysine N-methyltransferase [Alphaproteobacteria bacterium]|nr:SET domain-containing protein-lysine N-methyltransferase [Alphaproteobacteria bacterium]
MFKKKKPMMMTRKNGLYLRHVEGKGRGLFCTEDIQADDIIEVTPCMIFNDSAEDHVAETVLSDYVFKVKNLSTSLKAWEKIGDGEKISMLAMGAASYCNHAVDPAASVEQVEEKNTLYAVLTALRDIPKDSEITIHYGRAWMLVHRMLERQ